MDARQTKAAVNWYAANGFRIVPASGKTPTVAWKQYQQQKPTNEEMWQWWGDGQAGIALLTGHSGVIVVDADTENAAMWWWKNRPKTEMRTRTKNGVHFFYRVPPGADEDDPQFRNRSRVTILGHKRAIDVRGFGGYVVAPPSTHPEGGSYERRGSWDISSLPEFDPRWFDAQPMQAKKQAIRPRDDAHKAELLASKYISHIRAVSGQGGDKATFRAACKLIEFGCNAGLAMDVLAEWNRTNADPPWTEPDLRRKVECAYSSINGEILI